MEMGEVATIAYVPGYLLFVQNEALFTRPFNEETLQVVGDPVRIVGFRSRDPDTPRFQCPLMGRWRISATRWDTTRTLSGTNGTEASSTRSVFQLAIPVTQSRPMASA